MKRIDIKALFSAPPADGTVVTVCGWAKTVRDSKNIGFIELSDGTCFKNLQIVFEGLPSWKTTRTWPRPAWAPACRLWAVWY